MTETIPRERLEALGPAETIIQTLTQFVDHGVHNRPGIVVRDTTSHTGVQWSPVSWKQEGEVKVVYRLDKVGSKSTRTRIGILDADNQVREGTRVVGEYRKPGLFPEVVAYLYQKIADIWTMDNEFAAHFASWSWAQDHRDLKAILAAFMLVQSRSGEPVKGADGKIEFCDDDFRAVGEAMCLLRGKGDLSPKLLLRVGEILELQGVADINRKLGFGKSARNPAMGRYPKAVEKWLRHREQNPRLLEGLVKAGFRTTVMALARKVGYKPESQMFFAALRWKQVQAKDGRRGLAIGLKVKAADSWGGLTERQVCNRIVKDKPNYKRLVGLLPVSVGLTRAVMAAAIDAGCLSDADIIILTPTIEELGLLEIPALKDRWTKAVLAAENQRATNIARNVKKTETADALKDAADAATAKAMEEVTRGLRVYVMVDISGSMQGAIELAKKYLIKMLGGFPVERLHVSVFNSIGKEIALKGSSSTAVKQAFRGISAGGGTSYAQGVRALFNHPTAPEEDALFIFVGDEGDGASDSLVRTIRESGLNPVAFGLLKVPGEDYGVVVKSAGMLNIPCFKIEEAMFNDPYSITRTLRNLIANTPVTQRAFGSPVVARKSLIELILQTPLLQKPVGF